jgi:hypothetical protein
MNEGTFFIVLRFPKPWPLPNHCSIGSTQKEDMNFNIDTYPDGHISFEVNKGENEIVSFHSQPLRVTGTWYALMNVAWKDQEVSMRLNGEEIKSLEDSNGEIHTVETNDYIIDGRLSFTYPEAKIACKKWMGWRKNRYASPKPLAKKNRRLKTIDEQIEEFQESIKRLDDIVNLVKEGKHYFVSSLATELRALVYWNGKHYSPLLLRMAGRFALPLPVFVQGTKHELPPNIKKPALHFQENGPFLYKQMPKQSLVDLQEWLVSPVLALNSANQSITLSAKELILNSATTQGTAHYDEDLPNTLEIFNNMRAFNRDRLSQFLLRTAHVVLELSRFVISNTKAQIKDEPDK